MVSVAARMESLYKSLYNETHNKIICIARNYPSMVKQAQADTPKEPIVFDKVLNSIIKSGEVLTMRRDFELHQEVELGVLIGMTGHRIRKEDWIKHIEGYFLAIDFTDVEMKNSAMENKTPWTIAKS